MIFRKLMVGISLCLASGQIVAMKRLRDVSNSPSKRGGGEMQKKSRTGDGSVYGGLVKEQTKIYGPHKTISKKGDFGAVLSGIKNGTIDVNAQDKNGEPLVLTALGRVGYHKSGQKWDVPGGRNHAAAVKQGHILVQEVIENPKFNGNVFYKGESLPHHWIHWRNSTASTGLSAEQEARENVIFEQLVSKCSTEVINSVNVRGCTPLHCEMQFGATGLFDSEGAAPVDKKKLKCIDVLLAHGANPNAQDKMGKTPLHYNPNNKEYLWLFASHGASPHVTTYPTVNHPQGQTAQDLAKNSDIAELLSPERFDKCGIAVGEEVLYDVVSRNQQASVVKYVHERSISGPDRYAFPGMRFEAVMRLTEAIDAAQRAEDQLEDQVEDDVDM